MLIYSPCSGNTKTTLSDFKNGCINSCNSCLIIRVINECTPIAFNLQRALFLNLQLLPYCICSGIRAATNRLFF